MITNIPQANTDPAYLASQELSATILERFLDKIECLDPDGCWIWKACLHHGYGYINRGITRSLRAPIIPAHLVSWILFHGPIPKGKMVLHKCPTGHRRDCVNPLHLSLGDKAENGRDSIAQGTNSFCLRRDKWGVKMTQGRAREIRARWIGYRGQQTELANEYGVTRHAISLIVRNVTWWEGGPRLARCPQIHH